MSMWAQIVEEIDSKSEVVIEAYRGMITYASQNNKFKNTFALNTLPSSSVKKGSLLKLITEKLLGESVTSNTQRLRLLFTLLRTLSMSGDIAKELMKLKTLEDILSKLLPVCKNEKDIKLMRHYLTHFSGFMAAFSSTEEGQKILLKEKELYELSLFLIDTIQPNSQDLSPIVLYNLMFLRNTAFNRTNKLHILSNQQFLVCLLSILSSVNSQTKLKAYAAACLWVVLFNHQGVKAQLNKP